MSKLSKTHRLFFALDLPDVVREEIVNNTYQKFLEHNIPKENLHITLDFLGDVGSEHTNKIISLAKSIIENTPQVSLEVNTMANKSSKESSILWLLIKKSDTLDQLQSEISTMTSNILQNKKNNAGKFKPHITLARSKKTFDPKILNTELDGYQFSISTVTLYRSILKPDHAQYVPIHRFMLKETP